MFGTNILQNYQSLDLDTVKNTLDIFAQLIDWNELSYFESLVQSCIQFLQFPEIS